MKDDVLKQPFSKKKTIFGLIFDSCKAKWFGIRFVSVIFKGFSPCFSTQLKTGLFSFAMSINERCHFCSDEAW